MIAIGLVGSAWLAYAATGPSGNAYPIQAAKVKAKGELAAPACTVAVKPKCSKFSASVKRSATGANAGVNKGSFSLKDANTKTTYKFKVITDMQCTNQAFAQLTGTGTASGAANVGNTYGSIAQITETSATTGSLVIAIVQTPSNAIKFTYSGPLNKAKFNLDCP